METEALSKEIHQHLENNHLNLSLNGGITVMESDKESYLLTIINLNNMITINRLDYITGLYHPDCKCAMNSINLTQ